MTRLRMFGGVIARYKAILDLNQIAPASNYQARFAMTPNYSNQIKHLHQADSYFFKCLF